MAQFDYVYVPALSECSFNKKQSIPLKWFEFQFGSSYGLITYQTEQ